MVSRLRRNCKERSDIIIKVYKSIRISMYRGDTHLRTVYKPIQFSLNPNTEELFLTLVKSTRLYNIYNKLYYCNL